jgi:predicted DNA-binding transcriptional regulator YafY
LKTLGAAKTGLDNYQDQLNKFDRIIGLNYNAAEKREYIEIAVSPKQYKYLKSLPIHPSQGFEEELKDGWLKISLHLIPNYELKMQLLKLGDQIKILRPKNLQQEIKNTLSQTLKLYDDE